MTLQPSSRNERRRSDVSLQDQAVARPGAEAVAVPSQRTDSGRVAFEDVELLAGGHVPHLNVASVSSHCHQVALKGLTTCYREPFNLGTRAIASRVHKINRNWTILRYFRHSELSLNDILHKLRRLVLRSILTQNNTIYSLCSVSANKAQSEVNTTLDGSTYPG